MKTSRLTLLGVLVASATPACAQSSDERRWLAGDHHVHSIYSASYRDDPAHPERRPEPIIGGDASSTIAQNAQMARRFGLDWMVSTDHGGPAHSELNYAQAWPDVARVRATVPELVLFYGMEFDVPGGEHSTVILPLDSAERNTLRDIEARFGKREAFPANPARNTKDQMIEALRYMQGLRNPPILIVNHPSRTATGFGQWGLHSPEEFLRWHQAAPDVVIGMEGAPGHQAAKPAVGLDTAHGSRGLYGGYPTMGGFDQMVATLGGGWDQMLASGIRWSITATSDFHRHWQDGGADFWPGEYTKTWVYAKPDPEDILDGLRQGRVFAVTGGLIDQLDFSIAIKGQPDRVARMGQTISVKSGEKAIVKIRIHIPVKPNAGGFTPKLDHVDMIAGFTAAGGSHGAVGAQETANARVIMRAKAGDWRKTGNWLEIEQRIIVPDGLRYVRLRGANTVEGEPKQDGPGEDPWQDLWFYSNPIYAAPPPAASNRMNRE